MVAAMSPFDSQPRPSTKITRASRAEDDKPLRVASWNLGNLGKRADEHRYHIFAEILGRRMGAPHIIAVQELCGDLDADGKRQPEATHHAHRLIRELQRYTGHTYAYCEVPNAQGSNVSSDPYRIRNGFFYRTDRIALNAPDYGMLTNNPMAWRAHASSFRNLRAPLIGQFTDKVTGENHYIANLHLCSDHGKNASMHALRYEQLGHVTDFYTQLGKEAYDRDVTAHFMVLGDFNANWAQEPVSYSSSKRIPRDLPSRMEAVDLNQATKAIQHNTVRSNHSGERPVIDHAFVSHSLRNRLIGLDNPDTRRLGAPSDHNPICLTIATSPPARDVCLVPLSHGAAFSR